VTRVGYRPGYLLGMGMGWLLEDPHSTRGLVVRSERVLHPRRIHKNSRDIPPRHLCTTRRRPLT
jgi:hypothetical protein